MDAVVCFRVMWLALLLVVLPSVEPVQTGWRPIPNPGPSLSPGPTIGPTLGPTLGPSHSSRGLSLNFPSHFSHNHHHPSMCVLYKAVFNQDMFPQVSPNVFSFVICIYQGHFWVSLYEFNL